MFADSFGEEKMTASSYRILKCVGQPYDYALFDNGEVDESLFQTQANHKTGTAVFIVL